MNDGTPIERGVPIIRRFAYPWNRLKVGDRFRPRGKSSGYTLVRQANEKHAPKRFESHIVDGVTWIWRVF